MVGGLEMGPLVYQPFDIDLVGIISKSHKHVETSKRGSVGDTYGLSRLSIKHLSVYATPTPVLV